MLSAQAELEDSGDDLERFNWARVSASDPRILTSRFLEPTRGVHPTIDNSSRPDASAGKFGNRFFM